MALASVAELSDERLDRVLGDAPIGLGSHGLVADDEGHGEKAEAGETVDGERTIGTPGSDGAELRSGSLILEIDQDVPNELLHEVSLGASVVLELVQRILCHIADLFGLRSEMLEAGAGLRHHVEHMPVEVRGDLSTSVGPVATEGFEARFEPGVENLDPVLRAVVDQGAERVRLPCPAGADEEDVYAWEERSLRGQGQLARGR